MLRTKEESPPSYMPARGSSVEVKCHQILDVSSLLQITTFLDAKLGNINEEKDNTDSVAANPIVL